MGAQELVDLLLEGIELGRPPLTLIARRLIGAQSAADRVAADPMAAHEILDRHATHEVLPSQLGPALHVQHAPSPGLGDSDRARLPRPLTPPPRASGGSIFNRRRGVSFPPALTERRWIDIDRASHQVVLAVRLAVGPR